MTIFALLFSSIALANPPLEGQRIFHKTFGDSSRPALVLVHGMHSSSDTFEAVAPVLAERYFVITYDQRGHGRTPDVGQEYSPTLLAKDLKSLLDHLKIEKAHILGHSFGARTAVRFAHLFKNSVLSLVIEDMDLEARLSMPAEADIKRNLKFYKKMPLTTETREEYLEAYKKYFGIRECMKLRPEKIIQDENGRWRLTFIPYVTYLYGLFSSSADLTEEFENLELPSLVLRASDEATAMSDSGAQFFASLPDVELKQFNGATHNIHKSQQEAFLAVLVEFLSKH